MLNKKERTILEYKEKILHEIDNARKNHFLAIVEGKKDAESLRKLGLTEIFILKENNRSLKETIEKIPVKKKAIILTDFDSEGKKLYKIIRKEFGERGIKIDDSLRFLLLKGKISHIEGLDSFLSRQI